MNDNMNQAGNQVPETGERLTGERFAWPQKKGRVRTLAKLYGKTEYVDYAKRASMCASYLQFYAMATGEKQLISANFCHLRLCPMCSARRAQRAAYKLSQVLDRVDADHQGTKYLFLTLTIKNCSGDKLGDTLGQITKSWARLMDHRQVKLSIKGWFRAVEITRRGKGYHPHIHAILAVEPDYFRRNSGLYISHEEWLRRWQLALRVDYKPSVRIQTAKAKGEYTAGRAAAVEAAKYAVKDEDYIDPQLSEAEAVQIVKDYTQALHRRRMTAFGGWLKEAARALDAENLDDGDLVHIEPDTIREDVADYIETYQWNLGVGDYVLTERRVNPLKVVREVGEV